MVHYILYVYIRTKTKQRSRSPVEPEHTSLLEQTQVHVQHTRFSLDTTTHLYTLSKHLFLRNRRYYLLPFVHKRGACTCYTIILGHIHFDLTASTRCTSGPQHIRQSSCLDCETH